MAWEKLAGTGTLYDGWYPGVGIANDMLYVGEYGGVVTLKDSD